MRQRITPIARSQLFLWMGLFGVAVAVIGFTKTFFYPLFTGTFSAHPMIYVHGAFLFGWVAFFLAQSALAHHRNMAIHKKMGWVGSVVVVGVVASTLVVATFASQRTAAASGLMVASSELLVIMIEMTVFAALVFWAILRRTRPEIHKRLMLLALIASLGPAWFRFRHYFPPLDNPVFFYSLLLADSLIVVAALSDWVRLRRIHWVYIFVGGSMIGVHLIEVFAFEAPWFQSLASALATPFI